MALLILIRYPLIIKEKQAPKMVCNSTKVNSWDLNHNLLVNLSKIQLIVLNDKKKKKGKLNYKCDLFELPEMNCFNLGI